MSPRGEQFARSVAAMARQRPVGSGRHHAMVRCQIEQAPNHCVGDFAVGHLTKLVSTVDTRTVRRANWTGSANERQRLRNSLEPPVSFRRSRRLFPHQRLATAVNGNGGRQGVAAVSE
jgi:hypothetical protein